MIDIEIKFRTIVLFFAMIMILAGMHFHDFDIKVFGILIASFTLVRGLFSKENK